MAAHRIDLNTVGESEQKHSSALSVLSCSIDRTGFERFHDPRVWHGFLAWIANVPREHWTR